MPRGSSEGARATENAQTTQMKPRRAKVTALPARDFSKGREAGAMKLRIKETKISEQQAGPLREYMKLMDELDEAQKVSTKGTPEQRKAALANIKEIASFIAENKKDLKDAGLKVDSLGLERKDNRKLLMRDRKDIFAPSVNVVPSGKAKEAPGMRDLSEKDFEASAAHVNSQIEGKERDLMEKFYGDDFKATPDLNAPSEIIERDSPNVIRSYDNRAPLETAITDETIAHAEADARAERIIARVNRGPDGKVVRFPGPENPKGDVAPPKIVMPELQPLVAQPEEDLMNDLVDDDETDQPKITLPKPTFWQRNPVAVKVARWGAMLGAGVTAFLGYQIGGPKNEDVQERERIELASPMSPESSGDSTINISEAVPAANVEIDDANVEISQPSGTERSGDDTVGETVSDSGATAKTKDAVREFRKSGDPRNLEDALRYLEIFEGKDAYLQGQAEASKADLQARLADLALLRSAMSDTSPAVEASKRLDMEKKITEAKLEAEDMISHLELMKSIRSQ